MTDPHDDGGDPFGGETSLEIDIDAPSEVRGEPAPTSDPEATLALHGSTGEDSPAPGSPSTAVTAPYSDAAAVAPAHPTGGFPYGAQTDVLGSGEVVRLGRYTLLELLGKGGMAEVYLAKQDGPAGFEKTCVVKRIRKSLTEEKRFVDMFLREARVAAKLNHANVVQIFELGQAGEEYFIAMEFLDGITLHRAARRMWAHDRSIPMEVILRTVADAALGLQHAHNLRGRDGSASPLIHRDISPDNLMLTRDGVTKVLDFGIAKSSEPDEVTKTGELKGKIPYMAPEQIRGDELDPRSDLWSLGCTFYWLLTGRRPFEAKTDHMLIDLILRKEPPPPRDINPLIPRSVQAHVMGLLHKDVEARTASAQDLHNELVALLGPASGPGQASSFANEVLNLSPAENSSERGSVITVVAARPETQWLKRIAKGEDEDLVQLLPERTPSDDRVAVAARDRALEFAERNDTGQTVTGVDRDEALAHQAGRGRGRAMAAGLVGALVLGGAAFVAVQTGDDEVQLEPAVVAAVPAPAIATPVAPVAAVDPPGVEESDPFAVGGPGAKRQLPAEPAASEKTEAPAAPSAPAVAPPDSEAPRAAKKSTRGPARVKVSADGPASITWRSKRGRRLGKGAGAISVAPGTTSVVAVDGKTGGRVTVPVVDGKASYGSVKKGRVQFLVRPWAEVWIGSKKLGTTPFDPVKLPEGRYQAKLKWKDKTVTRRIDVEARKRAVVKVDMRKVP